MKPRAFTLVELLTVIAIIGVLAAIILPVTAKVRQKARDAGCLSNLRQFGNALHLYLADNRDRFPLIDWHASKLEEKEGGVVFGRYIFPNIKDDTTLNNTVRAKMTCWVKAAGDQAHTWGYGFTGFLSRWGSTPETRYGHPASIVTQPSNHIYACCLANGGRWLGRDVIDAKPGDLRQATPKPHNGRVGWLFVDGHAKFEKVSKILKVQVTRDCPNSETNNNYRLADETTYIGNAAYDN